MGRAMMEAAPIYEVVGRNGALLLAVPRQAPVIRSRYLIQARRSEIESKPCIEVELYDCEAPPVRRVRNGRNTSREAMRLLDVGVWCLGAYVRWAHQKRHDFNLLDAVDLVLRRELPAEAGFAFPIKRVIFGSGEAHNFNA